MGAGDKVACLDLEIVDRNHGGLLAKGNQCRPSSRVKKTPVSVPAKSRPSRTGSARTTRVISPFGKSPTIDSQLLP
ncbi:hypothetical protein, partial [Mesorhizobium sp. M8A.F.Ca.ET.213.01.1.1]|uniref:hypothetical protein n=1 Tax=Mesorhizobium sp. M8A.F.Ca.ET.213.01.1.1 TaxID=2563970 RepID=UPI001AEDA8DE